MKYCLMLSEQNIHPKVTFIILTLPQRDEILPNIKRRTKYVFQEGKYNHCFLETQLIFLLLYENQTKNQ